MEELAEDTLYFLLKSGLQDRIQFDHQANANKQTDNSEQRWGVNSMGGVLTLCCVQVLGPGGQFPAAAAGPALVIQTRPADVWLQPPAVP